MQKTFPESRAFTLHPTTYEGRDVPATPQANDVCLSAKRIMRSWPPPDPTVTAITA
jgi:hypothetical protein